jgi:putative addiction module component (TIGR02574 family)
MSKTLEQVAQEALNLPSEDRARLADQLVESLNAAAFSRYDQLWAVEASRRLAEIRSGAVHTIPGDEVLAEVRRAVGR